MSDSQPPHLTFSAPELAELAPLFPGYEFHSLIATGGMGAVYCAVQKSLDRTVAIKILPQEFSRDASFCAGFEAEAKAMARLNHPNLIGVYDFGEINGMLFIIMEYVPGQSLFHSAHDTAIDPTEVIRLVTGICLGLAHAHSNGIIHRDIKPSNILLDLSAQPKIGDFGLARPIEHKVGHNEEIFGTPHYTAPEVVQAPQAVDYRADLFSVGVLLHELLTGRLPADDPRPASVIIHCDSRFDAIIRRATDPLPARRYTSAEAIAEDLRAIAATTRGPQRQNAPSDRKRLRKGSAATRKRPTVEQESSSAPALLMLLLAIIAGAFAYKHFYKPTPPVIPTPPTAPAPPPKPAPKPAPTPPPAAKPAPEPVEEPTATEPDNQTTNGFSLPAESKFDVSGFFARARKIMRERAGPTLTKYRAQIKGNSWALEKSLFLCANKLGSGKTRFTTELTKAVATWHSDNDRVPAFLESSFTEVPGVPELLAKAVEKQSALDNVIQQELVRFAPLYILGLEKQIERLKPTNDPAALALIEEEIAKTRDDAAYFPTLILGETTTKE